jgi:hypothetical protein
LAQSPLSLGQRKLLGELQKSVGGQQDPQAATAPIPFCPVETPGFQSSEFCLAEIIKNAFDTVCVAAEAAGVAVKVSTSGMASARVTGYAEHIHQLVILLAVSPLTVTQGIKALALLMAIKPGNEGFADMNLRITLATHNNAQDVAARLTAVTAAASDLQTASFNEAELGLAAGWQLALAMGAQITVETAGTREACLVLTLPMEMDSSPATDKATVAAPSFNGAGHRNGRDHHGRKAKGRQQPEEVLA